MNPIASRPAPRRSSPAFRIDDDDTLDEDEQVADGVSGRLLSWQPTVAVAEDDDDMRHLLVGELRRDGYIVYELAHGEALMSYLRGLMDPDSCEEAPDLIVTDIRMPGWSGMEVLDFLHEVHWALPVVLITAFGDRPTHAMAASLGAVRTLDKPFRIAELKATIYDTLLRQERPTHPPHRSGSTA